MASSAKESRKPSLLSLEDQFTFYSSYHSNPVNKAIHFVCIWPILWTALALFASLGARPMPPGVVEFLPLDPHAWDLHWGTLVMLVYLFVYCAMDIFAGGLAAILVMTCYVTSNLWVAAGGSAAVAGSLHVTGWLAQFYGHGVHEGRSPALVDNLFQALLAAPLFVLCEVLFELGYKPEMYARITEQAKRNVSEYQASRARPKKKAQ